MCSKTAHIFSVSVSNLNRNLAQFKTFKKTIFIINHCLHIVANFVCIHIYVNTALNVVFWSRHKPFIIHLVSVEPAVSLSSIMWHYGPLLWKLKADCVSSCRKIISFAAWSMCWETLSKLFQCDFLFLSLIPHRAVWSEGHTPALVSHLWT